MGPPWRLRVDAAADGPANMAIDAQLLDDAVQGRATLRLYSWQGPWLSLGYGQREEPECLARCAAAEVGVVRRMSGGAAVLHGADLTYSVASPQTALPDGLAGSYAWIGGVLLQALATLGVEASRAESARALRPDLPDLLHPRTGPRSEFDCFAAPAIDEICVRGRKLVGSAQRRNRGALLQHGSIRLCADPPTARAAAGLAHPGTSLAEERCSAARSDLVDALVAAFESSLGTRLPSF